MTFSRIPIVHRYWTGGLFAALIGFALGFLLWTWQQGISASIPDIYSDLKLWHARIQILLFVGSFLLGFALQSGPHVVGGQPPPSRTLLFLLPLLWIGFLLTTVSMTIISSIGNLLITLAYGGAAYFLFRITRHGNPQRRLPRGIPLAASFIPLAIAPWLALDQSDKALWVILCGPVTSALVAAQQLIQNVLGGTLLQRRVATLFFITLLVAWILSGVAVFTPWDSWQLAGIAWSITLIVLIIGSSFIRVAAGFGFAAINVTLIIGMGSTLLCTMLVAITGTNLSLDIAVHILGVGGISTLILGVVARVASFFSGKMVLNDRLVSYLLLVWFGLAMTRAVTPLDWVSQDMVQIMMMAGAVIILIWVVRVGLRLLQIDQQLPPELTK